MSRNCICCQNCICCVGIVYVVSELYMFCQNCICFVGIVYVLSELYMLCRNCICFVGIVYGVQELYIICNIIIQKRTHILHSHSTQQPLLKLKRRMAEIQIYSMKQQIMQKHQAIELTLYSRVPNKRGGGGGAPPTIFWLPKKKSCKNAKISHCQSHPSPGPPPRSQIWPVSENKGQAPSHLGL